MNNFSKYLDLDLFLIFFQTFLSCPYPKLLNSKHDVSFVVVYETSLSKHNMFGSAFLEKIWQNHSNILIDKSSYI